MGDERDDEADDRAAILRRRAVFVVSALAGLGLAACGDDARPGACLKKGPTPEESGAPASATASASASSSAGPADAGATDAGAADASDASSVDAGAGDTSDGGSVDAGTGDAGTSDAGTGPKPVPRPCLTPVSPTACLKVAPPRPCLSPPRPKPTACLNMR